MFTKIPVVVAVWTMAAVCFGSCTKPSTINDDQDAAVDPDASGEVDASVHDGSVGPDGNVPHPFGTDRHGKPPGHFEETPFPIDEHATSYAIMNDEYPGGRTYELGTKYHVDGAYTGADSDGTWERPWTTIHDALSNVGSGNVTVVVRGAHDGFDGVYRGTYSLSVFGGVDDTHRWMLVGYGQERPILDGDGEPNIIITHRNENLRDSYVTVQRLQIQNAEQSGIRLGWDVLGDKRGNFFNCIDIIGTNFELSAIYYLNADNGWIFHCTVKQTWGHGYKVGDGASDCTVEWSVAHSTGYWSGLTEYRHSAVAFDFPNDNDERDSHNIICRYNIGYDAHNYALQLRRVRNFDVHHNEFYRCLHHDEIDPQGQGTLGKYMIIIYAGQTSGRFHSNIVRDPASTETSLLYVDAENTNSPTIYIYNNLIYGATGNSLYIGHENATPVHLYNNSIYQDNDVAILYNRSGTYPYIVTNNILVQGGTGSCVETYLGTLPTHNYNLFHAPNGSTGVTLELNELTSDPLWVELPNGQYAPDFCALTSGSPAVDQGTDLGTVFGADFNGVTRPQGSGWDIGAFELW